MLVGIVASQQEGPGITPPSTFRSAWSRHVPFIMLLYQLLNFPAIWFTIADHIWSFWVPPQVWPPTESLTWDSFHMLTRPFSRTFQVYLTDCKNVSGFLVLMTESANIITTTRKRSQRERREAVICYCFQLPSSNWTSPTDSLIGFRESGVKRSHDLDLSHW